MMRFLIKRAIEVSAARSGTDADYMLALYSASPKAVRGMAKVSALLAHREAVPVEAAFAAQLTGALEEGCGSCVQIHIAMARKAGVEDALIEAILTRDLDFLPPDVALAASFALAISRRSADEVESREGVRARWGDRGVVDLVIATQLSRFLTMFKAGFGHATTCGPLQIGDRTIYAHGRGA